MKSSVFIEHKKILCNKKKKLNRKISQLQCKLYSHKFQALKHS